MSNKTLTALLLLLSSSQVFATDEEQESWDVAAIPGEAREVSIDTAQVPG